MTIVHFREKEVLDKVPSNIPLSPVLDMMNELPTVSAAVHFGDGRDETVALSTALRHPLFCQKDIIAIVGIAKMDAKVIAHKEYPVKTIIFHEEFDNETMSSNIALLKTDTVMQFNSLVWPLCFLGRKLHKTPTLQNCWVAG
ncbi:Inactive Serine Protease 54 [Manis pentadactyla]|nr:Inactive Serine Protease 54 [Manis pentadactyla]